MRYIQFCCKKGAIFKFKDALKLYMSESNIVKLINMYRKYGVSLEPIKILNIVNQVLVHLNMIKAMEGRSTRRSNSKTNFTQIPISASTK
jgi:hypothetical protein